MMATVKHNFNTHIAPDTDLKGSYICTSFGTFLKNEEGKYIWVVDDSYELELPEDLSHLKE